ncbi:MAG: hypothetical protein HY530_01290 [Chloroflexi bacterium]|nr:hypothetical protein [Chloroflexota bacterium]
MSISGGDLLLELFRRHGIEYVFCSPGTEWIPVWEGLARSRAQGDKAMKYVNCRHESLAISAAMGYARATSRLPAILLHANAGTLHGAMAIRAASLLQTPLIVFSTDCSHYTEYADGKGPGWWWLSQLSSVESPDVLVRPYVKWSNAVTSKESLVDSLCRGCQIAQTPPRGPVFLSVPRGLLFESLPEMEITPACPSMALSRPHPDDVGEAASQLLRARQPIIITERAGPGAANKLVELAELLGAPVFECIDPTFANFPDNHPLHMGYDASQALREADVVFVIGATTPWYPPSSFPGKGARVIFLDEYPLKEQLPYWGYRVDLSLTGDIEQWLAALVDAIRARTPESAFPNSPYRKRFEMWRTKHEQMAERWKAEAISSQNDKPISSKWFLYLANKALPKNSIIMEETIIHRDLIFRYLTDPEGYFGVSAGGLGIGLGMAAGVKLASADRPVIFFVGDGTFSYNPAVAALGLFQEYHLPVLTIVLNNGGYVTMKSAHQACYPDGWAVKTGAYLGVDITPPPDYVKVAEAFGGWGEKLEESTEIEPALRRALEQIARGRPALLNVVTDSGAG